MNNPLRICHLLASHSETGGLEKNVIDLANAQAAQGHAVTVLTSAAFLKSFSPQVQTREGSFHRSRRDPRLWWQLHQTIRAVAPEILHAHASKAATLSAGIKTKAKKVTTVHNQKRRLSFLKAFDAVIAVSQNVADCLPRLVDPVVIWNAVDPATPEQAQRALALSPPYLGEGKPIFCAAARFVEAKGFEELLDAFSQTRDCYLWLVGSGPQKQRLAQMIHRHGLSPRVWMPGFLPPEATRGLMQLADCFLITSHYEGGPYTLAEALMARGVVLSTKVGYALELLTPRLLFAQSSSEAIGEKMQEFISFLPEFQAEMTPLWDRAQQELRLEGMVRKVEQVYRGLL